MQGILLWILQSFTIYVSPPPWDFNHFPTWWYWWNKGYIINECPLIQNQKQTTGNSCMRVWNEFCSIGNGMYIGHYSRQAKPKFFRCFVGSGPKFQWKKSWRPKILIKHLSLHFSGNISCPLSVCYLSSVKSEKNNPPRHHLALLSTSHEMCVLILKVMPPAVMVYCCFRHFLVLCNVKSYSCKIIRKCLNKNIEIGMYIFLNLIIS